MNSENNNMFAGVTTVFVDVDDTLWWFAHNSPRALEHTFHTMHFEGLCSYEHFRDVYLKKNVELWDLYHYGKITTEFLRTERFRYTLKTIGYKANDIDAKADETDKEYLFYLSSLSETLPGAEHLLQHLKAKGYKVVALSNGFINEQRRKLQASGLYSYIDRMVVSDECGFTKPMPAMFAHALEVCGASAADVVMIGDNPDADIRGAHDAGWRTIYYNLNGKPAIPGTADAEVERLSDVERLL